MEIKKNAVFREREKKEQIDELGREILENARNELFLHLRFLDVALGELREIPAVDIRLLGTDGAMLWYHARELAELFRADRRLVNRTLMHTLMHGIFGHLYVFTDREAQDPLTGLACDITAEYLLDELYLPCLHHPKSSFRLKVYQTIREALPVVTAQGLFRLLCEMSPDQAGIQELEAEFVRDDHSRWYHRSPQQRMEDQKRWKNISKRMQTEMETFASEASAEAGSLREHLAAENRRRYNYRDFLRKFSVLREEMLTDPDSFDYIFYHYGLELYGRMPLIEPLETKEVHRIEEFVIVIDTSMSCKGELIRGFLEETCSILTEQNSFSRQVHIHLIQCDEKVQRDSRITDLSQLESYMSDFEILGLGGTDFRPAFVYVNELLARGEIRHLRGLLYFTDGRGIYPVRKPVYDTAFIFMKNDYTDVDVPPWAMKVILDPAVLVPNSAGKRKSL